MRLTVTVIALTVGLLGSAPAVASAAVFTVNGVGDLPDVVLADSPNVCDTSTLDAGNQCTLRAAIEEANDTSGSDVIAFALPGPGVGEIVLGTVLPDITGPVMIDGYTQTGAAENTAALDKGTNAMLRVMLNGENLPFGSNGLTIGSGAAGSEVRGLIINRFATGILINAETTITGNFIGTDASGQGDLGNAFDAIFGFGGTRSFVGGPDRADRNLLSGNDRAAVTTNSVMTIQGNLIGVAADGATALGNSADGIEGSNPTGGYLISSNVIAFNGDHGIQIENASSGSTFRANRIFSNAALGIDLSGDGRTANDLADIDSGTNELQNFPTVFYARSSRKHSVRTRIKSTLDSLPNQTYLIEFFSNPPGGKQAEKPIGTRSVNSGADGYVSFIFTPDRRVPLKRTITATATNELQSTSEISAPRKVRRHH